MFLNLGLCETEACFMFIFKKKSVSPDCIAFPENFGCSTCMKIKQVLLRSLNLDLAT